MPRHVASHALPALSLAALGVVFGDIGTSPLFAFKECVNGEHGVPAVPENVLGIVSLMLWSLIMVVAVKCLTFVLRADNEGEGGVLALLALVPLSTAAAVIASQALISGVYSLTNQAVQLGYFPRVTVLHTSARMEDQIYIPEINWGLAFDLPFLFSNLLKFLDGAWVPLAVGAGFFAAMVTWKRGRALLAVHFAERAMPLEGFFELLADPLIHRVEGTCVFMASSSTHVPPILVHHIKSNRTLHENVILLNVMTTHSPTVREERRLHAERLGKGVWRLVARYGFTEQPDVPKAMRTACGSVLPFFDPDDIVYYIGRETLLSTNAGHMNRWQERLFAFLSRNALSATTYFRIPPDRVVELGMQLDL